MQHFTASDGARLAYADEGAGRPLVLLHGLMAHSGFFRQQRDLSRKFRLICVDLRGHGESRFHPASPTVEQLAGDVAELADSLDLRDAIVVGWSLGASVLWQLLTGPEGGRFAGAVVVDMTPRVLNDDGWDLGLTSELCEARTQSIQNDFESFAAGAGAAIFAQPLDESSQPVAEWAGEEFARNDPVSMGALWASLVEQDYRPLLSRIQQPTLIIHGAHSQLYSSATADHLARALPNARSVQFDRSGHAPHLEQPQLFNRVIQDFAASVPPVRMNQATN